MKSARCEWHILLVRPGVVDFMDIVARKSGVDLALEEIMVGTS